MTEQTARDIFFSLLNDDLGFRRQGTVTAYVSLEGSGYTQAESQWSFYNEALNRLRSTPGVEATGAVSYLPLARESYMSVRLRLDSGQPPADTTANAVTPGYFEAIGTRIIAGRDFRPDEAKNVVIVDEKFARDAGRDQAIVGRNVLAPWTDEPYEIVGVVEPIRLFGPEGRGSPLAFWQVEEEPPPRLTFVARVRGDPESYLSTVRHVIQGVDPRVPVYDVKTMETRFEETIAQSRFFATAVMFFTLLAALLAGVSVYGVVVGSVARRRGEIGVRMALGSSLSGARLLASREGLAPVVFGLGAGVVIAFPLAGSLEHLIEGARPLDLGMSAVAAASMLLLGAAAAWAATSRVAHILPADVLRGD